MTRISTRNVKPVVQPRTCAASDPSEDRLRSRICGFITAVGYHLGKPGHEPLGRRRVARPVSIVSMPRSPLQLRRLMAQGRGLAVLAVCGGRRVGRGGRASVVPVTATGFRSGPWPWPAETCSRASGLCASSVNIISVLPSSSCVPQARRFGGDSEIRHSSP